MARIDASQQLAAAVQAQLTAARQRGTPRQQAGPRTEGTRRGPYAVSAAMTQRIQAIAEDDPDRPRKAVRIYLESEFAREFGASLLNDPEFAEMLDAVQQRLEDDAQTAGAVQALGRLLLAGRASPS
jgi:hypothetical protein